jgi:tRNA guanosine-2'-O-methyltransferase
MAPGVQGYCDRLIELGLRNRPHVLHHMLFVLCSAWRREPELALMFMPRFRMLLIYREPVVDETNSADFSFAGSADRNPSGAEAGDEAVFYPVTRVLLLRFLDELDCTRLSSPGRERLTAALASLIEELIDMNFEAEYVGAAIIGSDRFGEKLRCWQALCIMSKFVSEALISSVGAKLFAALKQNVAHGIRVHMEIFIASLMFRYPQSVIPALLTELKTFNHPQQVRNPVE